MSFPPRRVLTLSWFWPFLVAVAVRLIALDLRPLWYDEAFGVLLARRGWEGIATATWRALIQGQRAEHHPPLFYLLQHAWIRGFGDQVSSVRLMAVVLSLAAWWAGWRLAHRWLRVGQARVAIWWLSLHPFLVHYSQEARMYSLLLFSGLTLLLFFDLAVETGQKRWWAATGLAALVLLYTHNAALLYLVAWGMGALLLVVKHPRSWKPLVVTGLAVFLGYLPWLWVLWVQVGQVRQAYWIPRPGLVQLVNTLVGFTVHVPLLGWQSGAGLFLSLWLLALAWARVRRYGMGVEKASWLLWAMLAPWVAVWLFSLIWLPVYLVRLLLVVGALYLFWLTLHLGLDWPLQRHHLVPLAGMVASILLGLQVHWTYTGFPYAPYAQLGTWLLEQRRPQELVVHANKLSFLPMLYTTPQLEQIYLPDPPGSGSDTLSPAMRQGLGIPDPIPLTDLNDARGVWLLVFRRELKEFRSQGREHPALAYLNSVFCLQGEWTWGALEVYHFQGCP